jgi:hypothetical protein
MSRADLIQTYLSALNLTSVAIVGAGRLARITTDEPEPGETIQHRFYFKPSAADLVLLTIGRDGMSGKPAAVLAAQIKQTAATLGAKWQTPAGLRNTAECQVAIIAERVKTSSGRVLKPWNARYRQYRLAQIEKGEKAIAYWSYIESKVVIPTVRSFASAGQMIA